MANDVLFFGCVDRAGHHLWDEQLRWMRSNPCPWSKSELDPPTDTVGLPRGARIPALDAWMFDASQREGEAVLSNRDGWTRLGWADRSVDRRAGSHANVIAKGTFTGEEMLEIARRTFPSILARMTYAIEVRRTAAYPVA